MFGSRYYGDRYFAPRYFGKGSVQSIEVPDVVGDLQADATTELEGAGFVVAVATAYSSVVAAGHVISQSPVGGSFELPGSTVTITVSLGDAPVVVDSQATGGWLFLNTYESELQRRKALAQRRKELEEETEQIEDALDRNIAQLLREQEEIDEKKANLERLGRLAKIDADLEAAKRYSERVGTAYARAIAKGTFSALEALDRELQRAKQEDEFLLEALQHFLND